MGEARGHSLRYVHVRAWELNILMKRNSIFRVSIWKLNHPIRFDISCDDVARNAKLPLVRNSNGDNSQNVWKRSVGLPSTLDNMICIGGEAYSFKSLALTMRRS